MAKEREASSRRGRGPLSKFGNLFRRKTENNRFSPRDNSINTTDRSKETLKDEGSEELETVELEPIAPLPRLRLHTLGNYISMRNARLVIVSFACTCFFLLAIDNNRPLKVSSVQYDYTFPPVISQGQNTKGRKPIFMKFTNLPQHISFFNIFGILHYHSFPSEPWKHFTVQGLVKGMKNSVVVNEHKLSYKGSYDNNTNLLFTADEDGYDEIILEIYVITSPESTINDLKGMTLFIDFQSDKFTNYMKRNNIIMFIFIAFSFTSFILSTDKFKVKNQFTLLTTMYAALMLVSYLPHVFGVHFKNTITSALFFAAVAAFRFISAYLLEVLRTHEYPTPHNDRIRMIMFIVVINAICEIMQQMHQVAAIMQHILAFAYIGMTLHIISTFMNTCIRNADEDKIAIVVYGTVILVPTIVGTVLRFVPGMYDSYELLFRNVQVVSGCFMMFLMQNQAGKYVETDSACVLQDDGRLCAAMIVDTVVPNNDENV